MKKVNYLVPLMLIVYIAFFSCNKDDDGVIIIPPRDRGEESAASQIEIEEYLETHFYNYEEFENPPAGFDFKIKFDTIQGDNALKTPLINQVVSKNVTDINDQSVSYKLYYLSVIEGEGDEIEFPDISILSFKGELLSNGNLIDASTTPVRFDLTQIIDGLQSALVEFKGATNIIENADGTLDFENYGVGAVFIPSGLGYFASPPPGSNINSYSQLIFSFQLFNVEKGDQDGDGIISTIEDLDGSGFEGNDDTDGDFIPNFADVDDDGDGRLTEYEIELKEYTINPGDPEPVLVNHEVEMYREIDDSTEQITIHTVILEDKNENGIPDYLDDEI
jgi:hypothetical protein